MHHICMHTEAVSHWRQWMWINYCKWTSKCHFTHITIFHKSDKLWNHRIDLIVFLGEGCLFLFLSLWSLNLPLKTQVNLSRFPCLFSKKLLHGVYLQLVCYIPFFMHTINSYYYCTYKHFLCIMLCSKSFIHTILFNLLNNPIKWVLY